MHHAGQLSMKRHNTRLVSALQENSSTFAPEAERNGAKGTQFPGRIRCSYGPFSASAHRTMSGNRGQNACSLCSNRFDPPPHHAAFALPGAGEKRNRALQADRVPRYHSNSPVSAAAPSPRGLPRRPGPEGEETKGWRAPEPYWGRMRPERGQHIPAPPRTERACLSGIVSRGSGHRHFRRMKIRRKCHFDRLFR
jgi:hypothetical protein